MGQISALVVAVGIALLAIHLRFSPQGAVPCDADFYALYHSALDLRAGMAPYGPLASWIHAYVPGQQTDPFSASSCLRGMLEFSYTPFFGMMFIPFTWLPYSAALAMWDVCELLLLCGAISAFLRAARISPKPVLVLALADFAMFAGPFRFELYYAQADIFMLFFICAALWARSAGRLVLAGLLLTVACASEPALLAIVALLLWKREVKFAAVTLGTSLMLIVLPFIWLGSNALQDLILIWRFYSSSHATNPFNDAPYGVLLRLFTPNTTVRAMADAPWLAMAIWGLLIVAVLLAACLCIERKPLTGATRSLLDVGLAATALLLISPYAENNHFTLLLLPFLAVYVSVRRIDWSDLRARWLFLGFACALCLSYVLGDPFQRAMVSRWGVASALEYLYVLMEASYLYPLIAIAAVALYAQRQCGSVFVSPRADWSSSAVTTERASQVLASSREVAGE